MVLLILLSSDDFDFDFQFQFQFLCCGGIKIFETDLCFCVCLKNEE